MYLRIPEIVQASHAHVTQHSHVAALHPQLSCHAKRVNPFMFTLVASCVQWCMATTTGRFSERVLSVVDISRTTEKWSRQSNTTSLVRAALLLSWKPRSVAPLCSIAEATLLSYVPCAALRCTPRNAFIYQSTDKCLAPCATFVDGKQTA